MTPKQFFDWQAHPELWNGLPDVVKTQIQKPG